MNEQDSQTVAGKAWDATKTEEQPEFSALNPDFKTRLYGEVNAVETFGPTEGNAFHAAVRDEITALMIDQNAEAGLLAADEPAGVAPVVDKADGTALTQGEETEAGADEALKNANAPDTVATRKRR